MLVLTRNVGETLVIGDDVRITILSVKGCQVRIGIQAPKDITVHREEIFEKIIQSGQPAPRSLSSLNASGAII